MKKRGISPLIAWILLIGISISAAILVSQWSIEQTKKMEFPKNKDFYCDEVDFELNTICKVDNFKVKFNLTNNGAFTIQRLTVGRELQQQGEGWCLKTNVDLEPGQTDKILEIIIGSNGANYQNISEEYVLCDNLPPDEALGNIVTLELVPWVEIENEAFHCMDKSIILNSPNLAGC